MLYRYTLSFIAVLAFVRYLELKTDADLFSKLDEFGCSFAECTHRLPSSPSPEDALLPFAIQGIDTDCGSEFINYGLLDYCEDRLITFTRARTHRINDQAHG